MSEPVTDNTQTLVLDNDSFVISDYIPISPLSSYLQDSISLSDNAMKQIDSWLQHDMLLILLYSSTKKTLIPLLVDSSSLPFAYSQAAALLTIKCLYLLVLIFSFFYS